MKVCTTCGAEWPDDTKFCPNDGSTLRSDQTGDLIGSVIADRYHIEKKLGEGGMGAVYLGEHVRMGRKSAIKVMTQAMANDPEAIARFNREAANAARINHHNVCGIYDFGETDDGTIYLAMEFIEGEALSDVLKREGALDPHRAADILEQTGAALQAAHDLGIVHRDLKPDNIMIAKGRDGKDLVKVVDFGIAKAMGGEEGQKVTKTGLVVGTPEYMSPEQLSGDVLDGRSDIYSLALVLYRMLTGTLPFQADSAQETMIKRLTDEPLKLSEVRPDIQFPPRLQEVLDHALQRMPADRYDSAAKFAADVKEAVSAMGAAPASVDTEGATQLIDSGDVTDQLAATRVAQAEETPTPETPIPQAAPPAVQKKKPVVAIAASVAVLLAGGGGVAVMMTRGGEESQPAQGGSNVTVDTAQTAEPGESPQTRRPAAAQEPPAERETASTDITTPPVDTRPTVREPTQPAVDTLAVIEDFANMVEEMFDPSRRAQAMVRAEAIYNNTDVPLHLRARAASLVATGHNENGSKQLACQWIGQAIGYAPTNSSYLRLRSLWECSS